MSQHRFSVLVDVNDDKRVRDGRLDTPDTWDRVDLEEALREATAVVVEIDDHEEFES